MQYSSLKLNQNFVVQKSYDGLFQYFTFCKWAPFKMQKIIEEMGPSRQLFETIDFPFMKILDILVWIALF